MYKIIYQIADIHIKDSRRDEYNTVFTRLYDYLLKDNSPNALIVVCGDIFDSKTKLTPNNIIDCCAFLRNLSQIHKVIIIAGNHDRNMNNDSAIDLLTPIIQEIKNIENVHYLNQSIPYTIENIIFYPFCLNDKIKPQKDLDIQNKIHIALLHEDVEGAQYLSYVPTNTRIVKTELEQFDYSLLGHIHNMQFISPRIAYSGSLIQQSLGESLEKGIIRWDLSTGQGAFVQILNDYGYIRLICKNDVVITKIPEGFKPFDIAIEYDQCSKKFIKDTIIAYETMYEQKINRIKDLSNIEDVQQFSDDAMDLDYQCKLLRKFLQNQFPGLGTLIEHTPEYNLVESVINLHKQLYADFHNVLAHRQWSVKYIEWSNLLCYRDLNRIEFSNMKGILGIVSPNRTGKTSIIDILIFTLFNKIMRGEKRFLIHEGATSFCVRAEIQINEELFLIEKKGSSHRMNVNFKQLLPHEKDLTGASIDETYAIIISKIGTLQNFLLTACHVQNNKHDYIYLQDIKQKEFIYSVFGLNELVKMVDYAKEKFKEFKLQLGFIKKPYNYIDHEKAKLDLLELTTHQCQTNNQIETCKQCKASLEIKKEDILREIDSSVSKSEIEVEQNEIKSFLKQTLECCREEIYEQLKILNINILSVLAGSQVITVENEIGQLSATIVDCNTKIDIKISDIDAEEQHKQLKLEDLLRTLIKIKYNSKELQQAVNDNTSSIVDTTNKIKILSNCRSKEDQPALKAAIERQTIAKNDLFTQLTVFKESETALIKQHQDINTAIRLLRTQTDCNKKDQPALRAAIERQTIAKNDLFTQLTVFKENETALIKQHQEINTAIHLLRTQTDHNICKSITKYDQLYIQIKPVLSSSNDISAAELNAFKQLSLAEIEKICDHLETYRDALSEKHLCKEIIDNVKFNKACQECMQTKEFIVKHLEVGNQPAHWEKYHILPQIKQHRYIEHNNCIRKQINILKQIETNQGESDDITRKLQILAQNKKITDQIKTIDTTIQEHNEQINILKQIEINQGESDGITRKLQILAQNKKITEQIKVIDNNLQDLNKQINTIQDLNALTESLNQLQHKKIKLQEITKQNNQNKQVESEIADIKRQIESIKTTRDSLSADRDLLTEQLHDILQYNTYLQRCKSLYILQKKSIQNKEYEHDFLKIQQEITKNDIQLSLLIKEKEILNATNVEIIHQNTISAEYDKSIIDVSSKSEQFNMYQKALSFKTGIPNTILVKGLDKLVVRVNQLLQVITDFTLLFEDCHIMINSAAGILPVEMGSGFQLFVISLALRLCFMQLRTFPHARFLIYDEGFGCVDKTNMEKIKEIFTSLSNSFDYTLLITHLEDMLPILNYTLHIDYFNTYSKINLSAREIPKPKVINTKTYETKNNKLYCKICKSSFLDTPHRKEIHETSKKHVRLVHLKTLALEI